MIHEIQQTVWLDTPRGSARARFMIVNGDDCDIEWVCFHEDGQVWAWLNFDVRVARNITMGLRSEEGKEQWQNSEKSPSKSKHGNGMGIQQPWKGQNGFVARMLRRIILKKYC